MKKILSCFTTILVLFSVTILSLGFYAYTLIRPVSYKMAYTNSSVYAGVEFEGRMEFYSDSTMLTKNNSFNEGLESYYYYKDGYVFFMLSETEEEYQEEVANINRDFEGAVNMPFYASKINAFRLVSTGPDGYTLVYTCTPAIVFAVVGGIVEMALLGVSITALLMYLKTKKQIKE